MFTSAFLHNGCLNELREGNGPYKFVGENLPLKELYFSEVECLLLSVTVNVMLRILNYKAGRKVSLLIVPVILVLSHPTEVLLKQKKGENCMWNHSLKITASFM